MPLTKAEILADLQANLDAAFVNPAITDKRHILRELAETSAVMGTGNSAGGTPADISAGIDSSVDIDLIKQLLTDIRLELVNSKSIADTLIQDSGTTPRYFIRQDAIDQTTGVTTTTILNLDGSVPAPPPVAPLQPVKAAATNQVTENLYIAIASGTGYAVGDSLSSVRLLNGETGIVIASLWYNLTSGSTIASPPDLANLKGYEDKVEELLSDIKQLALDIAGDRLIGIDNYLNIIENYLNSLVNNRVTPDMITTGIQAAADIDAIIARLTSIDSKTVAAAPTTKTTIVGFTSIAAANNNLLDATGNGQYLDVRAYQSCELTLIALSGNFLSSGLIGSWDAVGTSPTVLTAFNPSNGVVNSNASVTAGTSVKLAYDLTGVSFVRIGQTAATANNRVIGVFSPVATTKQVVAQIAGTVPVVTVGPTTVRNDTSQTVAIFAGTATASSTSATQSQSWGISQGLEINVTVLTAGTTLVGEIQEAVAGSTVFRTAYKFAPITAAGYYRSPLLPNISGNWRYVETISGTTPSVTRTVNRIQSNLSVPQIGVSTELGGFNFSDLPVPGRLRSIVANNNGTTKLYLQVHNKATALVPGDIPLAGRVFPVVAGGLVTLTVADLGEQGSLWAPNTRLALSTTFSTWTSPTGVGAPNQTFSLNAEVI